MDYLMAIDLGSTSIKAMIFDLDGNCVGSGSQPTERVVPPEHPDWVIWEPDQIWQSVGRASQEAVAAVDDPSLIRGVAVTGMGMDGVPVDRTGQALYPFISWHDPRTAEQAQWWQEQVGSERTFSITGFPSWAITAVMRILWMKQHQADIMQQAYKWLLIEDYVNSRLCGVMATEPSMASCMLLMDQAKKEWSGELVEAAGLDMDLLPPIRANGTRLGPITSAAAAATGIPEGTPIVLGGHDHICGALPLGLLRSGSVLDLIGTWESVQTVVPEPVLTPEIFQSEVCMQSHVIPGAYVAWGGAVAGESLEWFKRELGKDAERSGDSAGAVWKRLLTGLTDTQPGAAGVMFLPHISAAGCPIGDTKSMGAFVGINAGTRRDDMLRAVIEGLNYQFLHILEVMQGALGTSFDMVTVTGGVSQNEFWIQNKADMLGIPVTVSEVKDASPLGAALVAGLGLKLYANPDEAFERVRRSGKVYQPHQELTAQYQQNFDLYKQVYPALKPVNHDLFARFRSGA